MKRGSMLKRAMQSYWASFCAERCPSSTSVCRWPFGTAFAVHPESRKQALTGTA
ncbi:MAG: hypothetical protein IPL43_10595 [Micropruina sp.]|nr:hypothetical protein [Micropruina sp.]